MRQLILDTETTGLEPKEGHRVIEIGCVELIDRKFTGNNFHVYINPEREVDAGALKVHGISNSFLKNKPVFKEVYPEFIEYLGNSELIIHNAPFDVGFLNHEFKLVKARANTLESFCGIVDTLQMAREMHPGQRNSLDALCKRYQVDNSNRKLHGALLDAEILAKVYLAMTGGQNCLFDYAGLSVEQKDENNQTHGSTNLTQASSNHWDLPIVAASATEIEAHQEYLEKIDSEKW